MTIHEKIAKMPKTELHLHIEGSIPLNTLLQLIHLKEPQHQIQTDSDLRSKLQYKNFREFIMTWIWMTGFFQKESDFELIAYSVMENLHHQNVTIAEAYFSPFDYGQTGLKPEGITEHIIAGVKRAKRDFGIKASVIADVVRNHTYEPAITRLQRIEHLKGEEFIGIGLGGSEHQFPNELFQDVFDYARGKGFRTVAHAGEASGADSVKSAIDILKAERIGHGIRSIENPSVVKQLVDSQIPIEVCPTSNVATQVVADLAKHPIKKLYDAGVMITLSSDDPTLFHSTITDEYVKLIDQKGFMWNEIKELAMNGVKASFLSENEKTTMLIQFEKEFTALG